MWPIAKALLLFFTVVEVFFSCFPQTFSTLAKNTVFFEVDQGTDMAAEIAIGSKEKPQKITFPLPIKNISPGIDSVNAVIYLAGDPNLGPIGTHEISPGNTRASSVNPTLVNALKKNGFVDVVVVYSTEKPTTIVNAFDNVIAEKFVSVLLGESGPIYYFKETVGPGSAIQPTTARILLDSPTISLRASEHPGIWVDVQSHSSWIGIGCTTQRDFMETIGVGIAPDAFNHPVLPRSAFIDLSMAYEGQQFFPICIVKDASGQEKRFLLKASLSKSATGSVITNLSTNGPSTLIRPTVRPPTKIPRTIQVKGRSE